MRILAHGSGIDELIAFLAIPVLWGLYVLVRGGVRRARGIRPPAETPEDDGPGEG